LRHVSDPKKSTPSWVGKTIIFAKPSQAKPSQAKPSQAKPSQAKRRGPGRLLRRLPADARRCPLLDRRATRPAGYAT